MRSVDDLFVALGRSKFRSRFRLGPRQQAYLAERGLKVVMTHARMMIAERLGSAQPANDGRQTPMRGHPVFIAQHATATCCRKCLANWHGIPAGQALSEQEIGNVLSVLRRWLQGQRGAKPSQIDTLWGHDSDV